MSYSAAVAWVLKVLCSVHLDLTEMSNIHSQILKSVLYAQIHFVVWKLSKRSTFSADSEIRSWIQGSHVSCSALAALAPAQGKQWRQLPQGHGKGKMGVQQWSKS